MKFKVMCWKFERRYDIHYKTQTGTSCEKCNSKAFRLGIEPATSGLLDQCSTNWATEAVADNFPAGRPFFATGPGLGLIMYIISTLEFPTHNLKFHLLTTSVNVKYYGFKISLSVYTLLFLPLLFRMKATFSSWLSESLSLAISPLLKQKKRKNKVRLIMSLFHFKTGGSSFWTTNI